MSGNEQSNVRTSAGSTLFVSASKPTSYDEAGFKALFPSMKEVAEITDLGEFGRKYELVTHKALGRRNTVKRKGSYDDGSINLPLARDAADEGQRLLKAASVSDDSYSYCIQIQDGTCFFFSAQCMSFTNNIGSVDSITGHNAELQIDADIIEVLAEGDFQLTYTAGANGSIVGLASQVVAEGESGAAVYAAPAAGYVFEKWSDNLTANPRTDADVTADISVTATFIPE